MVHNLRKRRLKIIENKGNGIFQLSNNSEISYYEYAKEFYRLKPEKLAALNGKVDSMRIELKNAQSLIL